MRSPISMIVFAVVMLSCQLLAQNQQWPMVNSDKGRCSWASFETLLYPPLHEVASYEVKNSFSYIDGLTLYNNLLCISLEEDPNTLEALDLQTGDTLWTFQVPGTSGANDHTAAQNDSMVFFGGQWGEGLYALYRETGEIKWFKPCGSLYSRNVILDEDRAYFVCDSLYCIDIKDGSSIWAYHFNNKATPTVDDNYVYVCGFDRALAFDKYNGSPIWEQYNGGPSFMPGAVDDLYFYTSTNDSVVARSRENGAIQWAYPIPDGELARFAQNGLSVSDSFLCFICWENDAGKAMLYTLDKRTGNELWRHTFDGEGVFPSVIVNGVVYLAADYSGELFGFDVSTGQQVFYNNDYQFEDQPIVVNHKLYAGAENRVIVFENVNTPVSAFPAEKPVSFGLLHNFPNPFNAMTEIEFNIAQAGEMLLTVFNIQGQVIQVLSKGRYEAGPHRLTWDAEGLPSGIYICRLENFEKGNSFTLTTKMILQK